MPKNRDIGAALKKRADESAVEATQNEQFVDDVYKVIVSGKASSAPAKVQRECREIPASKLRNFFTAQIGFRPYTETDLQLLADDIRENGLLEVGIARPIPGTDEYEVLSGRNRRDACILIGWDTIPFHVEECDDARAIVIATATNLLRRQRLLYSERGWAYRALVEAQRVQGKRTDLDVGTCVEIQHKLKTRQKVAKIFGIKAHEVQRDIRLTYLIPILLDAVDEKRLPIGHGTILAGYDEASQRIFYDVWQEKKDIPSKLMRLIKKECPTPSFNTAILKKIWECAEESAVLPTPTTLSLSFNRERFEPIIEKLGGEKEVERLFIEFLGSKV